MKHNSGISLNIICGNSGSNYPDDGSEELSDVYKMNIFEFRYHYSCSKSGLDSQVGSN